MKLASAIALKSSLLKSDLRAAVASASASKARAAIAVRASVAARSSKKFPLAIGVTGKGNKYRLAVRVQKTEPGLESVLEDIRRQSKGEMDVRHVGVVLAQQPWHQRRNRPLRIGGSIGHVDITAGTLGCFVTPRGGGGEEDWILSNNHVLANENLASIGDAILQPGDADGGRRPSDVVGKLKKSVRLKRRNNLVDAAIATIEEGLEYFYNELESLGPIAGVRSDPLDEGEVVYKVGRTTGVTKGRVSAIEVDSLEVGYDMGDIEFDGQIDVEPFDYGEPFSLGGDSGSLIVDSDRRAVALLFAGNDVDATFASPIDAVLDALGVDLVY